MCLQILGGISGTHTSAARLPFWSFLWNAVDPVDRWLGKIYRFRPPHWCGNFWLFKSLRLCSTSSTSIKDRVLWYTRKHAQVDQIIPKQSPTTRHDYRLRCHPGDLWSPSGNRIGTPALSLVYQRHHQGHQLRNLLVCDECILYRQIISNTDSVKLQEDINKLYSWSLT